MLFYLFFIGFIVTFKYLYLDGGVTHRPYGLSIHIKVTQHVLGRKANLMWQNPRYKKKERKKKTAIVNHPLIFQNKTRKFIGFRHLKMDFANLGTYLVDRVECTSSRPQLNDRAWIVSV